jgi:septal ring factor EnvC (AmiA/AmiB activator)
MLPTILISGPARRRSSSLVLLIVCLVVAASGCLRPEDREVAMAPPDPIAVAKANASASADRDAITREIAALKGEIAHRDSLLQNAAMGHAQLTQTLEEATGRTDELSARLRTATLALERVSAELRTRAEADAQAEAAERQRIAEDPTLANLGGEPTLAPPPDPTLQDTPVAGIPPLLDLD